VTELVSAMFIKGKKKGDRKDEPAAGPAPAAPEARPAPVFTARMTVDADQTYRYAEASGDDNPIHVNPEVAKMAGLPGIILHGLCTMAFASQAFVNEACAGDPRRLKRFAVRFSKPVLPGDRLETRAWRQATEDGTQRFGFEVVNQEGIQVITNGLAEVALA
jgi:acyl dehydratase